ncbi:MAG: AEC family transporter [Rubrobacter sp.]|nr:AEC family transporter [Rubrobacter sp.]
MLEAAIGALLPVFFVLVLGYAAGRAKRFDADQAAGLNDLVLGYALPASLFVGTVRTPREQLLQDVTFILALFIAFIAPYILTLALSRLLFHHSPGTAGLQALSVGFPTATFLGPAILSGLFGETSAITVAIAAVVSSLFLIAPTQVLLELDHGAYEEASKTQQTGSTRPGIGAVVGSATVRALRTPYVSSPLLGIALVLLGLSVPGVFDNMLELIGHTTSGVATFAAGLTLAAHKISLNVEVMLNTLLKMVAQPVLMAALVLALGIAAPTAREAIVICALPSAVMPTILSTRYRMYESEASSTLVFTSLLMIVTIPIVVFLTGR